MREWQCPTAVTGADIVCFFDRVVLFRIRRKKPGLFYQQIQSSSTLRAELHLVVESLEHSLPGLGRSDSSQSAQTFPPLS